MNLNHLRVFFAVANAQSFSRASEELHVSQPTISVQVKSLEQELGLKLFQQIGKRIYLTDAGNALYQYAKKIFILVEEAEAYISDYKGLSAGRLQIGASTTPGIYILPQILGRFKKEYPGIETSLTISNTQEVEDKILTNDLEIALVGGEGIEHPHIIAQTVAQDILDVVVAEEHPLAQRKDIGLDEILHEDFVMREPGSNTRVAFEHRLNVLGKKVNVIMQFSSVEAIKQAVAANLGISVLSRFAIDQEVCAGKLKVIQVPELQVVRDIKLIFHKDRNLSAPAKAFLGLLQDDIAPKCR